MAGKNKIRTSLTVISILLVIIYGSISEFVTLKLCGDNLYNTIGELSISKAHSVRNTLTEKTNDIFLLMHELGYSIIEENDEQKISEVGSFLTRYQYVEYLNLYDAKKDKSIKIWRDENDKINSTALNQIDHFTFRNSDEGLKGPSFNNDLNKKVFEFTIRIFQDHEVRFILTSYLDQYILSKQLEDVSIGKKGYCYVLDEGGTLIAHQDLSVLSNEILNAIQHSENPRYTQLAKVQKEIIESDKELFDQYTFNDSKKIVSGIKLIVGGRKLNLLCVADYDEYFDSYIKIINIMAVVTGIVLAIIAGIFYLLNTLLFKKLYFVTKELKEISEGSGDLKRRLTANNKDEIGILSTAYNTTIGKIHDTIIAVKNGISVVTDNSDKLVNDMMESSSALNEISANVQSTEKISIQQADSVSQMVSSTEEIIKTISSLDNSIDKQSEAVKDSVEKIENLVKETSKIKDIVDATSNSIFTLSNHTKEGQVELNQSDMLAQKIAAKSEDLLEASNIISELSEQTKLLSLNATIEAAHAGDFGKGFAVVAEEIKRLSDKTAYQSNLINENLKDIATEMLHLAAKSKVALEKFNIILQLTSEISKESNNQVNIINQQAEYNNNLLKLVKIIEDVTAEVKVGSAEMLVGGKKLMHEIRKIDDFNSLVKVSISEMASGVVQINHAVLSTKNLSDENKESVDSLNKIICFFEV